MTVRYDPLLAAGLAGEIAARLEGRGALALVLDRGRRTAVLRLEGGEDLRFLLAPGAGHVLLGPGRRRSGEARALRGLTLLGCEAPSDERALLLALGPPGAGPGARIAVELRGEAANVLLLDAAGRIESALGGRLAGGREARPGAVYAPPVSARRWRDAPPAAEEWLELLAPLPPAERRVAAIHHAAWLAPLNADAVLGEALRSGNERALRAAHRRYLEVRGTREAWLLERPGGLQPYPASLWEAGATRAGSLLEAMEAAAERAGLAPDGEEGATRRPGAERGDAEEEGALRRALGARLRRAERRRTALERELEKADAEALRSLGHLLLARQGEVRPGARRARLTGFDGRPVEVELDPALGPVENAQRLYEEARRRERAAGRLPGEIARAQAAAERLRSGLERLAAGGASEELWSLAGGRPGSAASGRAAAAALPYHRLLSSGGLEIRVGRGARANDDLTFHHSAPEDIWLHARQVPGAHVILRWGRREQNPPQRDLVEAAVAAAVNSEARHSGTVAVDWTRRKYVRKPRGAPPGSVLIERAKTLFVEPDPALLERLRPEE